MMRVRKVLPWIFLWTILKIFCFKRTFACFLFLLKLSGGAVFGQEGKKSEIPLDFPPITSLSQSLTPTDLENTRAIFISAFNDWYTHSHAQQSGKVWTIRAKMEAPAGLKEIKVSLLHLNINGNLYTAPLGDNTLRNEHIQALFGSWIPELREAESIPPFWSSGGKKYSIMIDPGHGGKDSGAVSSTGIMEKDLNISLSRLCAAELRKKGFTVFFTKDIEKDSYLPLPGRESAVQGKRPDLVISLHHDSSGDKDVKGFSVFYGLYQPHRDREGIKARVDKKEVTYTGELILDERTHLIYQKDDGSYGYATSRKNIWKVWDETPGHLAAQCKNIAEVVHSGLEKLSYMIPARGKARSADFFLLRRMGVPVVLIEAGYVSNDNEVITVGKPENQKRFAEILAETLQTYYYGSSPAE